MDSSQYTQAASVSRGPQPKVMSVHCPLGCVLADITTLPTFEQHVAAMKVHLSDAHGGIIEAELDQAVLEFRYRFARDLDQVLQSSGYISSWPSRMECPLGCNSLRKQRLEVMGQPLDVLTKSLGGLTPYQLQLHLESKHPGCPQAELSPTELMQKYQTPLPDSIRDAPAYATLMQSAVLGGRSRQDQLMASLMTNPQGTQLNMEA